MSKSFYESVKHSTQESHVQEAYNNAFKLFFNVPIIERKHQCDGYFETKTQDDKEISVLIEYKYDIHMKDRVQRSKVIAQCLGYLKQFEQYGEKLPKLIFIGDINECCVIHTNDLIKLLDLENVDWSVAPSSMGDKNTDLVFNIAKDVSPWVYDIDNDFNFKDVVDKITDLCSNVTRKLHITEKNIEKVYNLFCDRVIKDKKKVQANDLVSTFICVMLDTEHYYQHPKKKNILIANDKQVAINGDQFELFMEMHSTEYSPKEKRIMTAISDRLIEDTNRRNKGEFYTPTLFVDYAHKMIEKELGSHWKDNYVVWDCCCGTKNLTRDYRFKELYCSTLEQAELDISKNYNKEAISFQFDFLNDSLDDLKVKAPSLLEALELNRPICFFINPPYARATGKLNTDKVSSGVSNSNISLEMKANKLNSSQLINQFIYRIYDISKLYNLTNVSMALFSNNSWLTKCNSTKLLNLFTNKFSYKSGYFICADEFSNTSSNWGILFSVWMSNNDAHQLNSINVDCIRSYDGSIYFIKTKQILTCNHKVKTTTQFINENNNHLHETSIAICKDIKTLAIEKINAKVPYNYICAIGNPGNDIYHNNQSAFLYSNYSNGGTLHCTRDNFMKCTLVNSIRRLICVSWDNSSDFYDMSNLPTNRFTNDCLIYSTFNVSNYIFSLKQNDLNCKNEFFWMSRQEMLDLAEEYNNDYTYEDALNSDERFVYLKLQDIKDDLSPEAKAVLDKATELVKSSFKYREMFNESHPEYQINNWDCGFYQIKALLKEFMPDDLKEFRVLYKKLADKMRPMVYELGFLKK